MFGAEGMHSSDGYERRAENHSGEKGIEVKDLPVVAHVPGDCRLPYAYGRGYELHLCL